MAATTAARSPAASCWGAIDPAMTLAVVIVPDTLPLLRARWRRTRRIRIGCRLAQKDDDAAVHAELADMDVRLGYCSLQSAIRLRILNDLPVRGDRGGKLPPARRGHRGRLLVAGQQRTDLLRFGHGGCRQKASHSHNKNL